MAVKEQAEVVRDTEGYKEDEGVVRVGVISSTTSAELQDTMLENVIIRRTCHDNTTTSLTIL